MVSARRSGILVIWLLLMFASYGPAQTLPAPLDGLYGSWVGSGTLFGTDAEFSMRWEQVLSGAFARLEFHNATVNDGAVDTVITAVGYYRIISADSIVGTWLDSRPVMQPLRGAVSDSSLIIRWGTTDTEQGKTVYQLNANGTVLVVDSVFVDNNWRGFGQATYHRVGHDP